MKVSTVSALINNIDSIAWSVIVVIAVVAAVSDVRQFRVPNALTLPLGLAGVIFHSTLWGMAGLKFSTAGLAVGYMVLMLFFVIGAVGAGDIKLLGGIGAWLGAANAISICLIACLAAGVYALGVIAARRVMERMRPAPCHVSHGPAGSPARGLQVEHPVEVVTQRSDRRWHVLPFAPMIALAVLVIVFGEYGVSLLRQG
jgi:prepilin peptidase CpaA